MYSKFVCTVPSFRRGKHLVKSLLVSNPNKVIYFMETILQRHWKPWRSAERISPFYSNMLFPKQFCRTGESIPTCSSITMCSMERAHCKKWEYHSNTSQSIQSTKHHPINPIHQSLANQSNPPITSQSIKNYPITSQSIQATNHKLIM
jgi:hypothetical protein